MSARDAAAARRRAARELGYAMPDECKHCREHITYVDDGSDGVWAECGCDAGYLW